MNQKTIDIKHAKSLNPIGKRLKSIRNKLELTQAEVCRETGIPLSSLSDRESGVRTTFIEEYLVLANYFNEEWKKKFPYEIKRITVTYIMFGVE